MLVDMVIYQDPRMLLKVYICPSDFHLRHISMYIVKKRMVRPRLKGKIVIMKKQHPELQAEGCQ